MTMTRKRGLEALKRTVGDERAARLSYAYRDRVQPAMEALTYTLSRAGGARARLESYGTIPRQAVFHHRQRSEPGPDGSRQLRDEYTFGLNRGYLLFDRIGAPTTFLVAVNRYVVEQFAHDLLAAAARHS